MKKLIALILILVCMLGVNGCSTKIYKGTDELMEIEIKENRAEYIFIHTHKPILDRADNVAIVNWNQGYVFLINNPEIATVQMTLQNAGIVEEIIQKGTIPYTFYVPFIPLEYIFIDGEGNEVE